MRCSSMQKAREDLDHEFVNKGALVLYLIFTRKLTDMMLLYHLSEKHLSSAQVSLVLSSSMQWPILHSHRDIHRSL